MVKTTYIINCKQYKRTIKPEEKVDIAIYNDMSVKITEVKNGKTITTLIPREQIIYIMEIDE